MGSYGRCYYQNNHVNIMTDIFTKRKRSFIMSRIRGEDTAPEILVRKFLFANGLRFRLYDHNLPGKPDIVLPKYRTVIFVNGCFWHGHRNCSHFKLPKTRTAWWKAKIERNRQHDLENHRLLKKMGYQVLVLWECGIENKLVFDNLIGKIRSRGVNVAT